MECRLPPPLNDDALSLALDGLVDEETQHHLLECPACSLRLQNMRQFDMNLQKRLKRFECPSVQSLADYYAGILDVDVTEAIRRHVENCPRCQKDIWAMEQFLNLPDKEPIIDNVIPFRLPNKVWKARSVQVSGNLALKGMDEEISHDASAGSATIFLESKVVPAGFLLTGQVVDSQVDWAGAVVEVRQEGAPEQVHILDEMGEFSFEFASATTINLYITSATGITVIVENIAIQT
jgi:hypothetical protein